MTIRCIEADSHFKRGLAAYSTVTRHTSRIGSVKKPLSSSNAFHLQRDRVRGTNLSAVLTRRFELLNLRAVQQNIQPAETVEEQ